MQVFRLKSGLLHEHFKELLSIALFFYFRNFSLKETTMVNKKQKPK